jgi:hypothetical protein
VEHYEISRYGTLKAWAEQLGLDDGVELLEETLDEEEATDEALTEIAKSTINQPAGPGGRIGAALPSRERGQFFGVLAVGLWVPGPRNGELGRGQSACKKAKSMNVHCRMRWARSTLRPVHVAMSCGRVARSRLTIPRRRQHPSRLPRCEQGRIWRLGVNRRRRK